jgi:hypothetical protein
MPDSSRVFPVFESSKVEGWRVIDVETGGREPPRRKEPTV